MKKLLYALLALSLVMVSCEKKSRDRDRDNDDSSSQSGTIPSDSQAGTPPSIDHNNLNIPNATFYYSNQSNNTVSINMSGIMDPTTGDFIDLSGTSTEDQTIWLQVDGVDKGILVVDANAVKAEKAAAPLQADIVFLVDNSGSMGEEADTIAAQIIAFSDLLNINLDVQVGCVGYDGGITGAIDLTHPDSLRAYLNDRYYSGTGRTYGFPETVSGSTLASAAYGYGNSSSYSENGMEALRFADEYFTFRPSANRIYINFTDEPNQVITVGSPWSVESLNDTSAFLDWNVAQGTVHSVFSEDTTYGFSYIEDEKPWLMSEYTGGTSLFILNDASDLDLTTLPVTGALAESSEIRFIDNSEVENGLHEVTIIVESANGTADGARTYNNVYFGVPLETE